MIGAVVERDPEIDDRESGEITALCGLHDSLLDGRNVVLGNGAAEDVINELEVRAARQRLHLDFAIAVLAVSAGLLLVASLHVGAPADGLAIRDFGSF